MPNRIVLATALILAATSISRAGDIIIGNPLTFTGGAGTTVYGATGYTCPGGVGNCTPVRPRVYLQQSYRRRRHYKASPGGGYRVANPAVGSNVAETPNGGIGLPGGKRERQQSDPLYVQRGRRQRWPERGPFWDWNYSEFRPGGWFCPDRHFPAGLLHGVLHFLITSWTSDYTVSAAKASARAFNAYPGDNRR